MEIICVHGGAIRSTAMDGAIDGVNYGTMHGFHEL